MKYLNYILIVLGAVIAMYSKTGDPNGQYFLIIGMIILMIAIYRLSKKIPSKNDVTDDLDNETE